MKELLIILLGTVVFVGVLLYKVLGPPVKVTDREKSISKSGIQATARVISMRDTGRRQERHPELHFKLELLRPGSDPLPVEVTSVVSVYQLADVVPGSLIKVTYDPDDPQSVVILKQ